jgi:hypothetical protein
MLTKKNKGRALAAIGVGLMLSPLFVFLVAFVDPLGPAIIAILVVGLLVVLFVGGLFVFEKGMYLAGQAEEND